MKMKKTHLPRLFATGLLLGSLTLVEARIWKDKSGTREIDAELLKLEDGMVTMKLKGGRLTTFALENLSAADQQFILDQGRPPRPAGGTSEGAGITSSAVGLKTAIFPPVSIEPQPVKGQGENRSADLVVTNSGDRAISRLEMRITLFGEKGEVMKTVPHIMDGAFGKQGKALGPGQKSIIELSDFWIKDDVFSVAGRVTSVSWVGGTQWPTWAGSVPAKEGDAPVSLMVKGILDKGGQAEPLIEAFNHSDRTIKSLFYQVTYLDRNGKELLKGRRTGIGGIDPGSGIAFLDNLAPPEGSADATFSITKVTFGDDPGVAMHSELSAEQINGREQVGGGNWKVAFPEERYLGFVVTETKPDGEPSMQFYWSAEPSLSHEFHFDHHEEAKNHELRFSPAKAEGDASGKSITSRFSDPEGGHEQRFITNHTQFSLKGPRFDQRLRGPLTLYSLTDLRRKPVFELKIVFAEDTKTAELALRREQGSR